MSTPPPRRPDPIGVPGRVSRTNQIQTWPGNTIVCHLKEDSPLWHALHKVQTALRNQLGHIVCQKMHLMPPHSWHMTVLDCTNQEFGYWPPEHQTLEECTQEFAQKLRACPITEDLAPPYRMRISGINIGSGGMHLKVEAQDQNEERRMRRLRDVLAETIGWKSPTHEEYKWHIGFCYMVKYLDEDEDEVRRVIGEVEDEVKMEFELEMLEFCKFENLHRFDRVLLLG